MTAGNTISCEVEMYKREFFATRFRIKERYQIILQLKNLFQKRPFKKMKFT
jgi:hypothetical protein